MFDFLSPIPPNTPRSGSGRATDLSPSLESDTYSGRDQRLSPRLSPRFPIPEAPEDLSNKINENSSDGLGPPPPYPTEAEDLSTKNLPVIIKQELEVEKPPSQILIIKSEVADPAPPPPPPGPTLTTQPTFQLQVFYTHSGGSVIQSEPVSPISNTSNDNSDISWSAHLADVMTSGRNAKSAANSRTASVSPKPAQMLSVKSAEVLSKSRAGRPRRKSRAVSDDDADYGSVKKAKKSQKKKTNNDPDNKKIYQCPHCNRTYDWNYNLNRHLKYECGKENAFQCSKCGRKFPHKQNCVYHLKRKHKVICDTVEQYMEGGFVLFRGTAGPAGSQMAKTTNDTMEDEEDEDGM